jgi:hypothetical protein
MRKVILMMLLAVVSSSAMAGWVAVVNATDNSFTIYADYNSIRKSGNMAEMWFMDDFETAKKEAGGNLYMSSKEQFRFDCRRKISRTIAYSFHSGKMGEGAVVYSDTNPSEWEPILPDSKMEVFWKIACGKK